MVRAQQADGFSRLVEVVQKAVARIFTAPGGNTDGPDVLNSPAQFPGPNEVGSTKKRAQASEGAGTSPEMELRAQEMDGRQAPSGSNKAQDWQGAGKRTEQYLEGAVKGVLTGAVKSTESKRGSVVDGYKGNVNSHRRGRDGFHSETR